MGDSTTTTTPTEPHPGPVANTNPAGTSTPTLTTSSTTPNTTSVPSTPTALGTSPSVSGTPTTLLSPGNNASNTNSITGTTTNVPTSEASPGYSAVITYPLPSPAQNSTLWYECTIQAEPPGGGYKPNGTKCRLKDPPAKSKAGPLAAAGVLAVLFVAALAAAVFLGILYRRLKKGLLGALDRPERTKVEAEYANYNGDPEPRHLSQLSELQTRTADLTAALQSRDLQVEALRGRLLNPQDPSPNGLDDNTINARFARLDQDVKDWVINHFGGGGSGEKRVVIGQELGEVLIAQVPMFDRLLQQQKTKTLVLRAVVAYVLQRAFETGEFLGMGTGLEALGGTMEANTPPQEFNKWRSQTFQLLSRSASPSAKSHAISTLTQYIDGLLAPFLTPTDPSTPPINPQERLQSLASIIEFFASLSTDLNSQLARFKIILDKPETPFAPETMDDVYQANETRVDPASGVAVNALNGKPILAVIFPAVVKWGNELGEGFDVASVIVKARVLT